MTYFFLALSLMFDGGGRVGDYLDLVSRVQSADISGVCASACTMKLGIRDACVYPETVLLFHAARNPDGGVNALGTLLMLQEYPKAVQAWALSRGALTTTRLTKMTGARAIALGVRECARRLRIR